MGTSTGILVTRPNSEVSFARFVALRSLDNNPVAVVAELGFRAHVCNADDGTTSDNTAGTSSTGGGGTTSPTSSPQGTSDTGQTCDVTWLPTTEWSVLYVESQDIPTNPPENTFDGSPFSVWHTSREANATFTPHEIAIDLGSLQLLDAFSYLPRQDASDSGMIEDFEFYVSADPDFSAPPVATGTFSGGKPARGNVVCGHERQIHKAGCAQ